MATLITPFVAEIGSTAITIINYCSASNLIDADCILMYLNYAGASTQFQESHQKTLYFNIIYTAIVAVNQWQAVYLYKAFNNISDNKKQSY